MSDLTPASPCENCLSPPERIDVPRGSSPEELPASVVWLRSDVRRDLLNVAADARAIERMIAGMREERNVPTTLLSTVVLSLAARSRVTLLAVSHRPGWASRLFGKSADALLHVAASGSTRGDEAALEAKLLDAVTRETGRKTPHGPSLSAAVGALFPSFVACPGLDILSAAKEDAVARRVARWITKDDTPPLPDGASRRDRRLDRLERSFQYYEILPAREAAVVSARRALEDLRSAFAVGDKTLLSRLETEIDRGLAARTSQVD